MKTLQEIKDLVETLKQETEPNKILSYKKDLLDSLKSINILFKRGIKKTLQNYRELKELEDIEEDILEKLDYIDSISEDFLEEFESFLKENIDC